MADEVEEDKKELTAKQKKNKKKKEAAKRKKQQKQEESGNINVTRTEDEEQTKTDQCPEEKFQQELTWCIEKMELGMMTQKPDKKQANQTVHLIKSLKSVRTPLPRKRQIMFSVFGDYRRKMREDFQRHQQEPATDPAISAMKPSQQKSIFLRTCHSTNQNSTECEVLSLKHQLPNTKKGQNIMTEELVTAKETDSPSNTC